MPRDIVYKLVVDDEGSIKKVELFGKEAESADKKAKKAKGGVKELGSSFGGLKNVIGAAAGGLGIAAAGFGIQSIIGKTSELAKETEEFHSITGIGTQSSLYYAAALKARGLSTTQAAAAFKFLARNLQQAERQQYQFALAQDKARAQGHLYTGLVGAQGEAFQRLGVSLAALRRASPEQQFQMVIARLSSMKDGMEKTAIATRLFGRGGTALMPMLDNNALGLEHQYLMAKKFFPTLKGEGVKALEELQVRQAESKMAWEGLEFTIGTQFAPALSSAMGEFSKLIVEMEKGKGPLGEVRHTFEGIARGAKDAFGFIKQIAGDLGVHLSGDTLGGVLAAAAAAHVGGKAVDKAKKPFHIAKWLAPYLRNPYVDLVAGAGLGAYIVGKTVAGGNNMEGFTPGNPYGQAPSKGPHWSRAELRRKAQAIGELDREANESATVARLFAHPKLLTPSTTKTLTTGEIEQLASALHEKGQSGQRIVGELHMDSTKVGEVIALNPKAMRFLAEAVERHAHGRNARR